MFDHRRLHSSLLGLKINGIYHEQVPGVSVSPEWVASSGLRVPCVLKDWLHTGSAPSGVGLHPSTPNAHLPKLSEIDKLAFLLQEGGTARDGPLEREVQTFDVTKQAPGPRWTFRQWCIYWKDRHSISQSTPPRNLLHPEGPNPHHNGPPLLSPPLSVQAVAQVRSVSLASGAAEDAELDSDEEEVDSKAVQRPNTLSLPSTSTDQLAQQAHGVQAQKTRAKDRRFMAMTCLCYSGQKPLCELYPIPAELSSTDLLSMLHLSHIASQVPQRQAVAVYPAGTVIDFALRPGGASAWWHVAEGAMLYVVAPPSERNLRMYSTWMEIRGTQHGLFLSDALEGLVKLQVSAGQSVLLPSGWLVAELALADSLLLGGTFLHAGSMASQLVTWEVEELCQIKLRTRFPMFRHVMWHAAVHYAKVLLGAAGMHALRKQRLPASHAPSTVITVSAAAQASVAGGGPLLLSRATARITADLTGVESRKRPTGIAALLTSDVEENIGESPSQPPGAKRIKLGGLSRQSGHEYRPAAMRRLVPHVAPDEEDGTRVLSPVERDRASARAGMDSTSSPSRFPVPPGVPVPLIKPPTNRIRIKLPPRANTSVPVPAAVPGTRKKSARQRLSSARGAGIESDDYGSGGGSSNSGSGLGDSDDEAGRDWQPKHKDEEMSSAGGTEDDDDDYADIGRGRDDSDSGSEAAGSQMGRSSARAKGNKHPVLAKRHSKQTESPALKRATARKEAAVVHQMSSRPAAAFIDTAMPQMHRAQPLSRQAAADAAWQKQQAAQAVSRLAAADAVPPPQQRRRTVADYEAGTVWQPSVSSAQETFSQGVDRQGANLGTTSQGFTTGAVLNRLQPRQQAAAAEVEQPPAIAEELFDDVVDGVLGAGVTTAPRALPSSPTAPGTGTGGGRPSTAGRARCVVSSDGEEETDSAVQVRRSPNRTALAHTQHQATGPAPAPVAHVGRLKLKLGGLPSSASKPAAAASAQLLASLEAVQGALPATAPATLPVNTTGLAPPHSAPKLTIKLPGLSKRASVIPQSDGAADDVMEDVVICSTAPDKPLSSCTAANSMAPVKPTSWEQEKTGITNAHAQQPLTSQPTHLGSTIAAAPPPPQQQQPPPQAVAAPATNTSSETAAAVTVADSVTQAGQMQALSEDQPHNGTAPAAAQIFIQQLNSATDTLMKDTHTNAGTPVSPSKQGLEQPSGATHDSALTQPGASSSPDLGQGVASRMPALTLPAGTSNPALEQPAGTSIPQQDPPTACMRFPEWLPPPPPLPAFPPPPPLHPEGVHISPALKEDTLPKQAVSHPVPKPQKVIKRTAHYVPPASQVANLVALGGGRERKRAGEPIHKPGGLLSPRSLPKAEPTLSARAPATSSINPLTKAALEQLMHSATPLAATAPLSSTQTAVMSATPLMPQPGATSQAATSQPALPSPSPSVAAALSVSHTYPAPNIMCGLLPPHPAPIQQQILAVHTHSEPGLNASRHPAVLAAMASAALDGSQHQTPPPMVRQQEDTIMSSPERPLMTGSSEKADLRDESQLSAHGLQISTHRPQVSTPGPALVTTGQMAAPLHRPDHHPSASKPTTVIASRERESRPTTSVESKVEVAAALLPPPHPPPRLTDLLSKWEIEDIPDLAATLRGWLDASALPDELPFNIRDPDLLLEQLEEAITALPAHFGPNRHTPNHDDNPTCTPHLATPPDIRTNHHTNGDVAPKQILTSDHGALPALSVEGGAASMVVSCDADTGQGVADTCPSQGLGRLPEADGDATADLDIHPTTADVVMARPGRPEEWLRFCTEDEVPKSWRACMARSPKVSHMAMPSDTAEETGETDPLTDAMLVGAGHRPMPRIPGVMHATNGGPSRQGEAGQGAGKFMSKAASQMKRKLGL